MKINLAAVLIPIYKKTPNDLEILSLKQCIKVLKNHKIIFFAPKDLEYSFYKQVCQEFDCVFDIMFFDNSYFNGIIGYNKLMLSSHFYKSFLKYKFILIYQLDAFVFKDDLEFWCNQKYDFIGAPNHAHLNNQGEMQFLKNFSRVMRFFRVKKEISNVGNGGFSLRNTRSCYLLVKILSAVVKKWHPNNEDGFFKYYGNIFFPFFKLPSDEEAIKFSIEVEAKSTLAKLNGNVPFGCHAFEKYEWETWKPLVEKYHKL